jgi:hypothetical protein
VGGAVVQAASKAAMEINPARLRAGTLRRVENIRNRYVDTDVGSGRSPAPAGVHRLVDDVLRPKII